MKIYHYLNQRRVTAVIMMDPTQFAVKNCVKKLGFQLRKMSKQPRGASNDEEVVLDARSDTKNMLGLSYYANTLFQPLIMDHLVGYFIARLDNQRTITVEQFSKNVKTLYQILRFEFIEKLKQRPLDVSIGVRLDLLV